MNALVEEIVVYEIKLWQKKQDFSSGFHWQQFYSQGEK